MPKQTRSRAGCWGMAFLILLMGVLLLFFLNPKDQQESILIPTLAPTLIVQVPSPTWTPSLSPTPIPTDLPPSATPIPPSPSPFPSLIPVTATRFFPLAPAPVEIALGGQSLWGEGLPPIYGRFGGLYDNRRLVGAGHVMISVPPGDFYIDTFEVSNLQFLHFLNASNITALALEEGEWLSAAADLRQNGVGIWELKAEGLENLPVQGISPWAARAYCANWGGQLPTLAEWQTAAFWDESAVPRSYPWGEAPPTRELAHFAAAEPIPPNELPKGRSWVGAYQLAGNVAEWLEVVEGEFAFIGGSFADQTLITGLQEATYTNLPQVGVGFRCILRG